MSERVEALEAELALARAEAAFVEAKQKHSQGKLSEARYRKAKDELRALRQEYREKYRPVLPGAQPGAVEGKIGV